MFYCRWKCKNDKNLRKRVLAGTFLGAFVLLVGCTNNMDTTEIKQETTTEVSTQDVSQTSEQKTTQNITTEVEVVDIDHYTVQDYDNIINEIKQTEAVDTTMKEVIYTMGNMTVYDFVGDEPNVQVTYMDLAEQIKNGYYGIIDTAYFQKMYDTLQEDRMTSNGTIRFTKDEVKQIVKDFYKYEGDINWDCPGIVMGENDSIELMIADGEMGNYISGYTIRENEQFYLLSGACFCEVMDEWRYYVDILFEKNPDSELGVSIVYFKTYEEEKNIVSIDASSVLADSNDATYVPQNLTDGDLSTAWVEGEDGVGNGTTITIHLDKPTVVYGMKLFNGYQKSKDLYMKNGRVMNIKVIAANKTLSESELYYQDLYDTAGEFNEYDRPYNVIAFDVPIVTDTIMITINQACAGTKYEDTALSEIEVY